MKVVLLVGGFGTRLSEKTSRIPKPMVEIGGKPILWHIMKYYSHFGFDEFVLCLGYKGELIKEYFLNIRSYNSDLNVDLSTGQVEFLNNGCPSWKVTMVDTGLEAGTGGRLKKVAPYLGTEPFCMTYGDGLANVNLPALVQHHKQHGRLGTVTAVVPPSRYGYLDIRGDRVQHFQEKPETPENARINGGFFVLDPKVVNYIGSAEEMWEKGAMLKLVEEGELTAFRHDGFWQCMDTLRERQYLDDLWKSGKAPWKVWDHE